MAISLHFVSTSDVVSRKTPKKVSSDTIYKNGNNIFSWICPGVVQKLVLFRGNHLHLFPKLDFGNFKEMFCSNGIHIRRPRPRLLGKSCN